MDIIPIELKQANMFVSQFHRHNKPVVGHKFSIGLMEGDKLIGVAIVGRPIARNNQDGLCLEVLRTCVSPGAPKGANSKLYARCIKITQSLGYKRLITYTLKSESGDSLRALNAKVSGEVSGASWSRKNRLRNNQKVNFQSKIRWELIEKRVVEG